MILRTFIQAGPSEVRWTGYGLTMVLGAVWGSLTSILAGALALLFLADLLMGVLKAFHQGGLGAFDWTRFLRAWLKLGAAVVGLAVFTIGDVLLQEAGLPGPATPLTSAALFGMCWGFFWSATQSLSHFFPDIERRLDGVLKRPNDEAPARERQA